jgi:RNA polymerase sigma-70 factor, ECF subfamily
VDDVLVAPAVDAAEAALVDRARRGDHAAFAALVDDRLAATFRTAIAILGNEAYARDATQEIFLRTWRNLPELRESSSFGDWFGRIVIDICRSATGGSRRRSVREISVADLGEDGEEALSTLSPHRVRISGIDAVERALDRLSRADRALLSLHHFEHLSLGEIGERLAIPSETVRYRLFSARRSLERAFEMERR